ncbi:MAG: hypothetical protein ACREUS_01155 [Burkholderiales bacterium]
MTEPPPAMEEEFNAWYDQEHLPERLAIPGFRSARRWVSGRTYLATYELDSVEVLSSAQYLSFYEKPTPWTRRCLGKLVVFKRWACEQVEPGDADPHPAAKGLAFALEPLKLSGVLQGRRFRAVSGEHIALYELEQPTARVYRLYES